MPDLRLFDAAFTPPSQLPHLLEGLPYGPLDGILEVFEDPGSLRCHLDRSCPLSRPGRSRSLSVLEWVRAPSAVVCGGCGDPLGRTRLAVEAGHLVNVGKLRRALELDLSGPTSRMLLWMKLIDVYDWSSDGLSGELEVVREALACRARELLSVPFPLLGTPVYAILFPLPSRRLPSQVPFPLVAQLYAPALHHFVSGSSLSSGRVVVVSSGLLEESSAYLSSRLLGPVLPGDGDALCEVATTLLADSAAFQAGATPSGLLEAARILSAS